MALPVPEADFFLRFEARARQRLGDDAYRVAWTTGRRISHASLESEMERLLSVPGRVQTTEQVESETDHLTPREQEVLGFLVAGYSNREIAVSLFISHRTAATHVSNILAKFGVGTRAGAVAYAFEHHML
jgi:DNA-binding NarL/FixJ family response regulator